MAAKIAQRCSIGTSLKLKGGLRGQRDRPIVQIALRAVSWGASLLLIAVSAMVLTSRQFVGFQSAIVLTQLAVAVSDLGLGIAVTKMVARHNDGFGDVLPFRSALWAVATVAAFPVSVIIDTNTTPVMLAAASLYGLAQLLRSHAFGLRRLREGVGLELSAGPVANIVESVAGASALVVTRSATVSLTVLGCTACLLSAGILLGAAEGRRRPRERTIRILRELLWSLPTALIGNLVRLSVLVVAASSMSVAESKAATLSLRVTDALIQLVTPMVVLAAVVDELHGRAMAGGLKRRAPIAVMSMAAIGGLVFAYDLSWSPDLDVVVALALIGPALLLGAVAIHIQYVRDRVASAYAVAVFHAVFLLGTASILGGGGPIWIPAVVALVIDLGLVRTLALRSHFHASTGRV